MNNRSRLRLVVLSVLIVSLGFTLLGRLWYLQVLAAPTYRTAAADNQVRNVVTEAPRGEVVDDEGRPLIDNKTAWVISVDRIALERQPDGGLQVLHRLARVLHMKFALLNHEIQPCGSVFDGHVVGRPCWNGEPYQPVPVSQSKPDLASTELALQIEQMQEKFPGVTAQEEPIRHYPVPDHALASSLLGYTRPIDQTELDKLSPQQQQIQRSTQVGATGLEYEYEKYLHGTPGVDEVSVDHVGAVTGTIKDTPPVPGDILVTNLDAKVQATLEHQLNVAVQSARSLGHTADYAAGVVLNVRTGGVVAMANYPTYQPNSFVGGISETRYKRLTHQQGHPLIDTAYQSANPPGSTFKLVSSLGLIHDGTANIDQVYDCPQLFQGRHNFDGENGKGYISIHEALVVSCDTFFFKLGFADWVRDNQLVLNHKKPVEGVQHMARDLGIGTAPDIDLPGATDGHIADRYNTKLFWQEERKQYCKGAQNVSFSAQHRADDEDFCQNGYVFRSGDQENEDLGQGTVLVSPLQLAVAYSAIANGGTVFEPRVGKAILSPTGKLIKRIKAPVRDHIPVSPTVINYLRDAFYGVVDETGGTAQPLYSDFPLDKVAVGGKTGTAELPNTSQDGSWFASFAGHAGGKPQYVTVIEVDKADQGAVSAAPASKAMWSAIFGVGQKPIWPDGNAPTKLPKIADVSNPTAHGHVATRSHHGRHRNRAGRGP